MRWKRSRNVSLHSHGNKVVSTIISSLTIFLQGSTPPRLKNKYTIWPSTDTTTQRNPSTQFRSKWSRSERRLEGRRESRNSDGGKNEERSGYLQHSQHAEGVLLDVQGPQHCVQVGQIFGQQLPTLVDQLAQLSHLAWGRRVGRTDTLKSPWTPCCMLVWTHSSKLRFRNAKSLLNVLFLGKACCLLWLN